MAGTTSAVPTVKRALYDALSAYSYEVSYGSPGDHFGNRTFWLGMSATESEIPTLKAGRQRRNETTELDFFVDACSPGGSPLDAEQDAFLMLSDLENILANEISLGGLVTALWLSSYNSMATLSPDGGVCRIEGTITISNRLN